MELAASARRSISFEVRTLGRPGWPFLFTHKRCDSDLPVKIAFASVMARILPSAMCRGR